MARHGVGVRESAYDMSVDLTLEHDRSVAAVGCAPRFIAQWICWAIRGAGARREWRGTDVTQIRGLTDDLGNEAVIGCGKDHNTEQLKLCRCMATR